MEVGLRKIKMCKMTFVTGHNAWPLSRPHPPVGCRAQIAFPPLECCLNISYTAHLAAYISVYIYSRNYSTIYLVKTLLAQNKNQIYVKGKPTFFILKKCPKCIFEDSLWVSFTGELPDDGCEAVEGDVAGSIVHLVDDVHHLLLGGIVARPPQRPHNTLQLMECRLETKSNICTTIIFKCEILYLHL